MKKSIAICLVALAGFIVLPASANIAVVANPEGDGQAPMIISGKAGLRNAPAFPADERISSCCDVLISESKTQDPIFELGEIRVFVIQDYANLLGLAPSLFGVLAIDSAGKAVFRGGITT
jgi:hypothetical protein